MFKVIFFFKRAIFREKKNSCNFLILYFYLSYHKTNKNDHSEWLAIFNCTGQTHRCFLALISRFNISAASFLVTDWTDGGKRFKMMYFQLLFHPSVLLICSSLQFCGALESNFSKISDLHIIKIFAFLNNIQNICTLHRQTWISFACVMSCIIQNMRLPAPIGML